MGKIHLEIQLGLRCQNDMVIKFNTIEHTLTLADHDIYTTTKFYTVRHSNERHAS